MYSGNLGRFTSRDPQGYFISGQYEQEHIVDAVKYWADVDINKLIAILLTNIPASDVNKRTEKFMELSDLPKNKIYRKTIELLEDHGILTPKLNSVNLFDANFAPNGIDPYGLSPCGSIYPTCMEGLAAAKIPAHVASPICGNAMAECLCAIIGGAAPSVARAAGNQYWHDYLNQHAGGSTFDLILLVLIVLFSLKIFSWKTNAHADNKEHNHGL